MSTAKHTPGPWVAEDNRAARADHFWGVYAIHAEPGHRMPAECHGPDGAANAKLIAAAPTLAEALESCASLLETMCGNTDDVANKAIELSQSALRAAGRLP